MIEDDLEIAELLELYLMKYDITLTNYDTPYLGVSGLKIKKYDMVILDLSLPEIDGIEVCKMIRKTSNIPIIISSARGDIQDKAKCFELGADDYLPKPYDPQELVLRINSILRRNTIIKESKNKNKLNFKINKENMQILQDNIPLDLTTTQYHIMEYFIDKSNQAISREELLLNVESIKYESSHKSIDVQIGRIRQKIEKNQKKPEYIISLRGVGYKLINL